MEKNYNIITDFKEIDTAKWNEFILKHPKGTIFHSYEMFSAFKNIKNNDLIFICLTCEDQISALLLAQLQQEGQGLSGYFSCRSVILSAPLITNDNPELLDIILRTYNKIVPKKVIYTQIRNQFDCSNCKDIYLKNGFSFEEHLNILVDISLPEEELWKKVHPTRRNRIRKARSRNLKFASETSIEKFDEGYKIISEVYLRAGLPLLPFSYFTDLRQKLNNGNYKLYLFTVKDEEKVIGCMFTLGYKNTLYEFYVGAISSYNNEYPNDLLPWEVFLWGKKNGYKRFDFGGAGKPGVPYGVREYKKKFGGEFVNYGRLVKVHSLIRFVLGKIALRMYKILKKVMMHYGRKWILIFVG